METDVIRDCTNGKILKINLSTGEIRTEPADVYTSRFLGGRGLNHWLLLKEMKADTSPFDPESIISFAAGTLSGTQAPANSRLNVAGKSPLTGGIGSGSAGGFFAPELRFAGYEAVVITGKAAKPSYIWIKDDHIALRDASFLWGKNTWETEAGIRRELKDAGIQTATIGPAGENLVNLSCIVASPARVVGRCGLGAVMGSKNLKAISVKGSGQVAVYDERAFSRVAEEILGKINRSPVLERTRQYGTIKASVPTRAVRNYQDEFVAAEQARKLHHELFKKVYEREKYPCCFNCPINCGRMYVVPSGIYTGTRARKLEANAISDFGPRLGIYEPASIVNLQALCDQYGLDMDNTAGVIAWAMECYERGLLSRSDTDGLDLTWGNHRAVAGLVKKIAYREGIGDLLSKGCKVASGIVGRQSERFCIHVKGQELMEAIRRPKAWALGVVVSERGGSHTRGAPLSDLKGISAEMGNKLWGVPEASDPSVYDGKAKIVLYYEQFHSVLDSLGICFLASNWADPSLPGPEDYTRLLHAALGSGDLPENIMEIGERIHTLGKVFNMIHAGFSRKDDYPPARLMQEPIKSGPFKGERLKKEDWDKMLDEYYTIHNWDKETGWCTKESLDLLNLPEVEDMLNRAGKLITTGH
ncbi:MAG: aldehyde ferredoxin oxidoreductase family protein [Deltaproteobacteria bacterium]|nr:aldehyde ferredoxin oxidoreductase family protein [Deltaproteobacteria bacterium]